MSHRALCLAIGMTASLSFLSAQEAFAPVQAEGRTLDCEVVQAVRGVNQKVSLREVAEAGLNELLAQFRADIDRRTLPEAFPFSVNDLSELDNAKIGFGYQVHTVNPKQLLSSKLPLEKLAIPTGIWNFLVMVDDQAVGLVEVEKLNGKWQMIGAGGAELAKDVQAMADTHAPAKDFRFIRIYQAVSDVMEVKNDEGGSQFVPLVAARKTLGKAKMAVRGSQLEDGASMAESLRAAVAAGMSATH